VRLPLLCRWFCYGVKVKVRFLSLNVKIGEELVVFRLGLLRLQIWVIFGLGGGKLFLIEGL